MNIPSTTFILVSLFLICSCDQQTQKDNKTLADRIFTNGKIYTLDTDQPWVEAVAIKNNNIVYVGDNKGMRSWIGSETIQQDLKGQMLLPGFIDSHAHPVAGGAYVNTLSLDTYSNPQGWLDEINDYSATNPDLEILFGYGFLASAFGLKGPTSQMLDSIESKRPVLIMDEGFHAAWANSKAMQLLSISKKAIDPVPGFSYYKRDNNGNPTGYLLEGTASSAVKKLGVITVESVSSGTADVIKIMNSYGITSVFDAGALDVESMQMDVLSKLTEQGKMTVRIVGSHMVASSETIKNAIEIAASKKATSQHGLYHINTLKIMNDGTIEGKTAGMFEDYQGESEIGNKGETVFSQQQLNGLVSKATEQDIDVHIHALGERTIFETLNAIEFAQKQFPNSSTRYTICHLQVMTDQSIQRMAQLNVIAQSTPLWASYDEYGKAFVSDDQFQRYFRFNSLNKAGVKMAFGSDYPATGAGVLGMSPIFNMEIGHTRQAAGKADALIQPNINERLEMQTLIKAYTIDGAYQLHMEDQIGSIKVGKQADFVILNENLFEVESYSIHKVKVVETILAGKTIYNIAN